MENPTINDSQINKLKLDPIQALPSLTSAELIKHPAELTPMMDQYIQVKKEYPDTLILYRMGDFYEVFFEDAILASKTLNITLTHRGKILDRPIPMAGIPHHAAANYIHRLTLEGIKLCICEQVEDPKLAKGLVKRKVTQIITPALPFDPEKTTNIENQFLASFFVEKNDKIFLILIDYTTGENKGFILNSLESLQIQLKKFSPKEVVSYLGQNTEHPEIFKQLELSKILVTYLSLDYFNIKNTKLYLNQIIPHFERDELLNKNKNLLKPLGALSYYLFCTRPHEDFIHIKNFQLNDEAIEVKISLKTLEGLEILRSAQNSHLRSKTLFDFMNATKGSMGTRLLRQFFLTPVHSLPILQERQKIIGDFISHPNILNEVRNILGETRDIERILQKAANKKITAQDLINLSRTIAAYFQCMNLMENKIDFSSWKTLAGEKKLLADWSHQITLSINDEIGASLDKGNLIKSGYCSNRDSLKILAHQSSVAIDELENRLKLESQISTLKIKSNNVAGYFIEISKSHKDKVPNDFTRKQTLVNGERYTHPKLKQLELDINKASLELRAREMEIFSDQVNILFNSHHVFKNLAKNLAHLDVFQSLAFTALEKNFTKPVFSDESQKIKITNGYHPLIESFNDKSIVSHSLSLNSEHYFALITGPNMAGKTTLMREVAIIIFLAQIGSYVPAKACELSLFDAIFSRLGASDDITLGQSTFMVEMTETAQILRHATKNSLIILDEIGRGTSTFDGMSIAWGLIEYLVNQLKACTFFSTHYHELTQLADTLPGAGNYSLKTIETKDKVHFLYELQEQGTKDSFGIHVAKLAGLPLSITRKAQSILKNLEKKNGQSENLNQLSFNFEKENQLNSKLDADQTEIKINKSSLALIQLLKTVDPNNLTPKAALDLVYQIKNLAEAEI